MEVNQIGQRDFLIKLICEQKRGGFTRFMEAINSLGLQVSDANVTTFCGKVLNILKVEVRFKQRDTNTVLGETKLMVYCLNSLECLEHSGKFNLSILPLHSISRSMLIYIALKEPAC